MYIEQKFTVLDTSATPPVEKTGVFGVVPAGGASVVVGAAGASPAWLHYREFVINPATGALTQTAIGAGAAPPALFFELDHGRYVVLYDAEANGEASGVLDVGAGLTVYQDRVLDFSFTRDSGRIQTALPAIAPGQNNGLPLADATGGVGLNATLAAALNAVKGVMAPMTGAVSDVAATAASFLTNLTSTDPSHYISLEVVFTSGVLAGEAPRLITGYNAATKAITLLSPFTAAPANGDTFTLTPVGVSSAFVNFLQNGVSVNGKAVLEMTQLVIPTGATPAIPAGAADATLTLMQALLAALSFAAGQRAIAGTSETLKTPAGTLLHTRALDSATAPTSLS